MANPRINVEPFRVSTSGLVSEPYIERGMAVIGDPASEEGMLLIDPRAEHGPNEPGYSDPKNLVLALDPDNPPAVENSIVTSFSLELFYLLYLQQEGLDRRVLISASRPVEQPLARVALLGILDHQENSYKAGSAEVLDIDKECMNLREYSVGKTAVNGSGLSLILVPEDRSVIVAHRPWVESAAISYELTYKPDDPRGIFVTPLMPGGGEPREGRQDYDDPKGGGSDREPRRPIKPTGEAGAEAEVPKESNEVLSAVGKKRSKLNIRRL